MKSPAVFHRWRAGAIIVVVAEDATIAQANAAPLTDFVGDGDEAHPVDPVAVTVIIGTLGADAIWHRGDLGAGRHGARTLGDRRLAAFAELMEGS